MTWGDAFRFWMTRAILEVGGFLLILALICLVAVVHSLFFGRPPEDPRS